MSNDSPGDTPQATASFDAGPEMAGGAELPSLALLAVAADPALVGLVGAEVAVPALDGTILGQGDGHVYDGHVALVLDPGSWPGMDSTLDLLTTSPDLFDVPAMDIDGAWNDATPT